MTRQRLVGRVLLPFGLLILGAGCSDEAPSQSTGCQNDAQCKGGRICQDHECVDPSMTSGTSATIGGTSATGTGTGGVGATTSTTGSGGAGPIDDPQGPQFLSFGANVMSLLPGQSITFSAVLTDPDGVDDIIGGNLLDQNGAPYGAFATSGQEGSYQYTISWDQIDQVSPIEFAYGTKGSRTVIARFFDQAGHVAERSTAIELGCPSDVAACAGKCVDTMTSPNGCGACNVVCGKNLKGEQAACSQGVCGIAVSECTITPNETDCATICAGEGKTCVACFENSPTFGIRYAIADCSDELYEIESCSDPISANPNESALCCCH